jgi:thioredoxin reductase
MGDQRNLRSHGLHGYLTRDGVSPSEFLRLARAELGLYGTVECRELEIVEAAREDRGFSLCAADGTQLRTRKLLLATGVVDDLPALDGLDALYGTSVHHCPYCDAWEWRDRPLAAYGDGEEATGLALSLTFWSQDVLLCTGGAGLPDGAMARLAAARVRIREEPVLRLEGRDGRLERVVFVSGEPARRSALFVVASQRQRSPLAERLGCRFTDRGTVDTGTCEVTNVPGLFVAGDASKEAQFVAVAAAEGTQAAMAIHKVLMKEDLL